MLKFTVGFLCETTVIDKMVPNCLLPSFVGVFVAGASSYFAKEYLYAKSPCVC